VALAVSNSKLLRDELERLLRKQPRAEFTLEDFCGMLPSQSRERLAIVLGDLVRSGKLKQIIRVYSRRIPGAGIGDFNSIDEIPAVIHDYHTDTNMEVTADDVVVIYQVV
jgi:hypothetical protein